MAFLKVSLVLSALIAVSCGKIVRIKNSHSTDLLVSVDGSDLTVLSNAYVAVTLADEWSGSITAVPVGAEVVDGPRTSADLSLSAAGDSYSVNLVNGFNLGVKIIPTNSTACASPVCAANLLNVCPVANQVTNSLGAVVACQSSPIVFSTICPLAVVDELTAVANVQSCTTASAYLVLFL